MSLLVGDGHQQRAADARLQIFCGDTAGRGLERGGQGRLEALHQGFDRNDGMGQSQTLAQCECIGDRSGGTPWGWHQQRLHLLGAQRCGGNHRHQSGVDASAEAEQGFAESTLSGVVPHPGHQRPEQQLQFVTGFMVPGVVVGGALVSGVSLWIPGCGGGHTARQLQQRRLAITAHHEAGAIKHQFVVAPHLVHVDHRAAQPLRSPEGQTLP